MEYIVYADSNNRDQSIYPNSNSYTLYLTVPIKNITKVEVLSAMLPNVFSSQYITLDIQELRTPRNLTASALTVAATNVSNTSSIRNLTVPNSNAFYGSFATVPVKCSGGAAAVYSNLATYTNTSVAINLEMYNANYRVYHEYPSRIDKLDRLTITWRQPNNGNVFIDNNFSPPIDLGRNMFLLRFETVQVPEEPERPPSLPAPVPWDSGEKTKMYIIFAIALLGFLLVLFTRRPTK